MDDSAPLATRLTTAEAHGEAWALFVRHANRRVELHKTDTFKQEIDPSTVASARAELEVGLVLVSQEPVPCLEALSAEVELLFDCPVCRTIYDTA